MSDKMNEEKEYIFPQGIIRGLGLLPTERKKWPDWNEKAPQGVGKEPEGVGKVSEGVGKEPEGVGQPFSAGYLFEGDYSLRNRSSLPNTGSGGGEHRLGPGAASSGSAADFSVDTAPSGGAEHTEDIGRHAPPPPAAVAKTNIQQAGHSVSAPQQVPPKFDPRGFWYTHGAFPSSPPQKHGVGVWQQLGQHWVWCPSVVTNLPQGLMAVCQVGMPGGGYAWTQIFNNYWVAPQPKIAVG